MTTPRHRSGRRNGDPHRLWALVIGVTLAVALTSVSPQVAIADECSKPCRQARRSCRLAIRKDFVAAKQVCNLEPLIRRECRRAASNRRRQASHDCRSQDRNTCRPCCRSGAGIAGINACAMLTGYALPAEPQQAGDPVIGRHTLLNGDFMTCGGTG